MKSLKYISATVVIAMIIFTIPDVGSASAADLAISGSSMLFPLEQVWATAYMNSHPGIHISVASTGSGFGIANAANGTITTGASDVYLMHDLEKRYPSLISIPVALEDAQVFYNIPGLKTSKILRMDGPTLAGIYMGKIRFWDDPAIRAINPDGTFPHRRIMVVHRSDPSGTTFVFTDYLAQTSKDWDKNLGRELSPVWPVGSGYNGSNAVVDAVMATPDSIGYVGFGWINKYHLNSMALKNRDGYYVIGSVKTIQAAGKAALLHAPTFPNDFNQSMVWRLYGKDVYPDANFEFWIVNTTLPSSTMKEVKNLLVWVLTEGQKSEYTVKTGFAPLPFTPFKPRLNKILNQLLPGNSLKLESGG
ncbi:MAG: phosphate ABC transporter substrate-binding protein PstS [Nitrospiraceae bacterium]|jgi:phosphate transport system substrate-binding protein|nr:phosphate ABC transporter substrate-binding protein PstS [Nitrospiraceae bacterium]